MTGWQAKYDTWGSPKEVIDAQNAISTKHDLTEEQARAVGNIIHTLTYNRAYRFEEMAGLFDQVYGWTPPCNCNPNRKRKHQQGEPGCGYYMSMGD